jgi:hypothetical protein
MAVAVSSPRHHLHIAEDERLVGLSNFYTACSTQHALDIAYVGS